MVFAEDEEAGRPVTSVIKCRRPVIFQQADPNKTILYLILLSPLIRLKRGYA